MSTTSFFIFAGSLERVYSLIWGDLGTGWRRGFGTFITSTPIYQSSERLVEVYHFQWGNEEINQILLWNFPFGLGFGIGLGLAIRVMNVQPCDPKIKFPSLNSVSPEKKPILNPGKAVWRHVNFKVVECINRSRGKWVFPVNSHAHWPNWPLSLNVSFPDLYIN